MLISKGDLALCCFLIEWFNFYANFYITIQHYNPTKGRLGPLLFPDWWLQHWLGNFNVLGFWRRSGLHQLVIIFNFAFSNIYFRSESYEEPNDTPDSCLYMCVENYAGMSQLDLNLNLNLRSLEFLNFKISLVCQHDFKPGISGEWGDKACTESGTTKYLCEKKWIQIIQFNFDEFEYWGIFLTLLKWNKQIEDGRHQKTSDMLRYLLE